MFGFVPSVVWVLTYVRWKLSDRTHAMADLSNPRLLWLKGGLFLLGGAMAAALLLLERPTFRAAILLSVTVWCFCRAYYFAFYVIEHYIDPTFQFRGLIALIQYAISRNRVSDR